MFERCTPEVRSALFAARWIAEARGCTEIQPEHLVAGVLTVAPMCLGSDQTTVVLKQLGHSGGLARRPTHYASFVPFNMRTKACLATASALADRLRHRWIRSEHLLESVMADVLTEAAQALLAGGVIPGVLEASALSRPPADNDGFSAGATAHAFVTPFSER